MTLVLRRAEGVNDSRAKRSQVTLMRLNPGGSVTESKVPFDWEHLNCVNLSFRGAGVSPDY
jgi:hypothetical protein